MQTGASPEQNPTYSDSKRKAKTHLKKKTSPIKHRALNWLLNPRKDMATFLKFPEKKPKFNTQHQPENQTQSEESLRKK